MATAKQIEANRRNAQHSTGPRTPDGKTVFRLNSEISHAFRQQFFLCGRAQLYPVKPRTEAEMDGVPGKSFATDSLGGDNFCRLARYESSIDGAFYRASIELQTLQKARIGFASQNAIQHEPAAAPVKRYSLQPNGKLIQLPSALPPTPHAATIVK